jgi:Family of unknown function (DUF5670)
MAPSRAYSRTVALQGASPVSTELRDGTAEGTYTMLWTIAVILLVLWGLGLVTAYTVGGYIHILLVLAIIVILIRLIQGRRVL